MRKLDEECARAAFATAFDRRGGIIGVIGPVGDIHAAIGLTLSRYWFTKEWHLEEMFNFVRPDHRRGNTYAEDLIHFAKGCAEMEGIDLPLVIGVLTNKRVEAKVRLYRKALGVPSGAFWVYNAKGWREQANPEFWKKAFTRHRRGKE